MSYLKEVTKRVYRIALALKARDEITRLTNTNSISQLLANALRAALENNATPEEKIWIARLESLRKTLISSSREIQIVDYGAGTSDLNLSDEQMYQGRTLTRTVGAICRSASKSYFWSFLLFKLIREFHPLICLELGTSLGVSGGYQASALKLNQSGILITLEGAESLALLAKENFLILGLDNIKIVTGRFRDTLVKVLNKYKPIDYVFIDGHHDERATLTYFEEIKPFLAEKAVLVFDDIAWSQGMKNAWSTVELDESVGLSLDLGAVGICVRDSRLTKKQNFKIRMI